MFRDFLLLSPHHHIHIPRCLLSPLLVHCGGWLLAEAVGARHSSPTKVMILCRSEDKYATWQPSLFRPIYNCDLRTSPLRQFDKQEYHEIHLLEISTSKSLQSWLKPRIAPPPGGPGCPPTPPLSFPSYFYQRPFHEAREFYHQGHPTEPTLRTVNNFHIHLSYTLTFPFRISPAFAAQCCLQCMQLTSLVLSHYTHRHARKHSYSRGGDARTRVCERLFAASLCVTSALQNGDGGTML